MPKKCNAQNLCAVCGADDWGVKYWFFSRLNKGFFNNVYLCKVCGHGQIVPVYTDARINLNNEQFLGAKYTSKDRGAINNSAKLETMSRRLSGLNLNSKNVLDIGAGEGWSKQLFDTLGAKYFAIEPIDELRQKIESAGGDVIARSIFDVSSESFGKFDVIIFRHIIEHLADPATALSILSKLLNKDGVIYLAAPNAAQPDERKGFRTSYLRPVHIHYFRLESLRRISQNAGLEVAEHEEAREVFVLLKQAYELKNDYVNCYESQVEIFNRASKVSLLRDLQTVAKQFVKHLVGRV